MLCPEGHVHGHRAIYYGFPVWVCLQDEQELLMWGFWSILLSFLPYTGWIMLYDGPYLVALWKWLKGHA